MPFLVTHEIRVLPRELLRCCLEIALLFLGQVCGSVLRVLCAVSFFLAWSAGIGLADGGRRGQISAVAGPGPQPVRRLAIITM